MNNVVKNSKTSPKKSVTAKQLAKSNLTKRKNPDWDNLDRGYRYLTLDMKLPHDLAVAVMGNVVEESLGDYKSVLKNGGGRGLIQWDGRKAPSGRYSLWGSIWASVAKPANVYDSTTDTVKNYWAPWGGLKGDKVRLKFIKAPLKEKARIYAESYLRPGKPRIADRQLSAMQLDSIYNPRIKDIIVLKDGGQIRKMLTAAGGPLNLSPEDIKKGANLIGEYFLKGLGAFGKIATAPFRSQGPTSATIYKSKELLAKERTIENKSEELLGKAMTWVSPLNYGAALATGNGLNARKGEEEVASWSPAWQALGRAAELYAGPKAVKGVKAAPRVVVNAAAKAGAKPAKAAVVAREINLATKNRPNLSNRTISSERYVNGTTGTPEVQYTLYNEFGEPIGQTKIGATTVGRIERMGARKLDRMVDGVYSKNKAHKVSEDTYNVAVQDIIDNGGTGLESGWSLMMPLKTLPVTSKFPHVVIGLEFGNPVRLLTGRTSRPLPQKVKGNHYLEIKPKTEVKFNEITGDFEEVPIKENIQEPSTSLKFFERKPSGISEAERLGIPRGDRGNLSLNLKLAIEDLALYKNSGLYRLIFRVTPDWEDFGWNLNKNNPTFMLLFIADKETMKGPFARVLLLTSTGKGVVAWNPEKNMGGYSSRSFITPKGMNWAPGEASMMLDGANGLKVILTAPKTDFFDSMVEESSKHLGENLSSTIDKNIMKDFWINSRKVQRPGSYMSGDNGVAPLGSTLIEAFKKKQLYKTPLLERPINLLFIRRTGLSPDSYSSIIRLGNRDGSLRWGEGFTKWNNSAVENKFINNAFEQLKKGEISPEQYEGIFNKWSLKIGGRPLQWTTIGELKIPVHPHPYIYAKKQGGKMNILEFLKNGSGIHIKEKNKGKFTSYCGGKVTDECILKGKNSSNPAIRKRATFAANARKWKHEKGGELIKKALWGDLLPTAEKAEDRYKNGEFFKEFYDGLVGPYNIGHTVVEGVRTNKPFHNLGFIQRKIRYVMGVPSDTTFTEIPPSFLPVKKAARVATRYSGWKNNMYAGNLKDLYNTLKNRWEKANLVMSRKEGGALKAQYGAPLNLSTEDIQGGLQYITQGLGKVWNIMNTPVVNVQPSTMAQLSNGSQVEIPGTLTGVVDDSFGKGGGGKKAGKKLLQSVAKSKDKGLTVTKKVDSSVRHGLVSVDQDLRHFGGGNRRMDPNELIKEMDKHVEFKEFAKRLSKRLGNLNKDNPQAMKDFKTLKNKYEDMFNDFLHNGIKKGQLGMALTLFNDSENPNAVGGDIVNSYIRNQLMVPYLLALKEEYEKWKLMMKLQSNTLKSSLFDNLLNTGLSIGTDYLKSKLGIGTEKAGSN